MDFWSDRGDGFEDRLDLDRGFESEHVWVIRCDGQAQPMDEAMAWRGFGLDSQGMLAEVQTGEGLMSRVAAEEAVELDGAGVWVGNRKLNRGWGAEFELGLEMLADVGRTLVGEREGALDQGFPFGQ